MEPGISTSSTRSSDSITIYLVNVIGISVWDDITGEPLGWFTLKLDNLPKGVPIELPLPLLLKNHRGEWLPVDPPGKIVIEVEAKEFGLTDEPQEVAIPEFSNLNLRLVDIKGWPWDGDIRARVSMGSRMVSYVGFPS